MPTHTSNEEFLGLMVIHEEREAKGEIFGSYNKKKSTTPS